MYNVDGDSSFELSIDNGIRIWLNCFWNKNRMLLDRLEGIEALLLESGLTSKPASL